MPPKPEYTRLPAAAPAAVGSEPWSASAPTATPLRWRNARRDRLPAARVSPWVMVFSFCRPRGGDPIGPSRRPGTRVLPSGPASSRAVEQRHHPLHEAAHLLLTELLRQPPVQVAVEQDVVGPGVE